MISLDTSVVTKWFKRGERHGAEALDLRRRIEHQQVEAAANEIVSLEVVRALKNAQLRQPAQSIGDDQIEAVFNTIESMFRTGVLLECPVYEVKSQAKDIELKLGLFMADALHLATAVYLRVDFFVVDDQHFLTPDVVQYAAAAGVRVVTLPDLVIALDAAIGGTSPPAP